MMWRLLRRVYKPDRAIRRADMLRDTGQRRAAARAYGLAFRLAPDRPDLLVQRGNMLKDEGLHTAAEAAYEHALRHMPADADTRVQLGHLAKARGDSAGAHRWYRDALAADCRSKAAATELRALGDCDALGMIDIDTALSTGEGAPVSLWPALRETFTLPDPPPSPARVAIVIGLTGDIAGADAVFFCDVGTTCDPKAAGWLAYAASLGGAWIADSDLIDAQNVCCGVILRTRPDPDWIAAGGDSGGPLLLPADPARRILADAAPRKALDAMRARLIRENAVAHIPLPLTASPGALELRQDAADKPLSNQVAISVIVPTRNNGPDAEAFIASLRLRAAAPTRLEIILIDNGSDCLATREALKRIPDANVLRDDRAFHWSALNNRAAAEASGGILLFANDDMLMLSDGWDDRLRHRLGDPRIGVVGARLSYPSGKIQHAGMLAGWNGQFIHDGLDAEGDDPGPGGRWAMPHAVSAVTGAFLGVRREDFVRLGGFDNRFAISYGDVDLCYRVRAEGRLAFYEPSIRLIHHESKTRGHDHLDEAKRRRDDAELFAFRARWGATLAEPATSPVWVMAGRPHRFVAPPGLKDVVAHMRATAAPSPWKVTPAPE